MAGLIPAQEAKIPHAALHGKKKKKKNYMGLHAFKPNCTNSETLIGGNNFLKYRSAIRTQKLTEMLPLLNSVLQVDTGHLLKRLKQIVVRRQEAAL